MIKNYTSEVPASRSISAIEQALVDAGAYTINKVINRESKSVEGIIFIIDVRIENEMRPMTIKLPAKINECFKVLMKQVKKQTESIIQKRKEQAERTAWKILHEWVQIQLSMNELQQTELMEIFLPYLYDSRAEKTFFESVKERNYKNLLPERT